MNRCPHCNQWMPDVESTSRECLVKEFTTGKRYRAYKLKFTDSIEFETLLELEKEGLIQRQTQAEEWRDTVIFTWIGPK
jgi:hypothetical protein